MRTRHPLKTVLAVVMAVALVASTTVAPVAAEDDATLDTDGLPVDAAESNESGVDVAVGGSGGGSSVGVECEVNASTDGNPCTTTGDGGGDAPALPNGSTPGGDLPVDPSDGAATPGVPGEGSLPGAPGGDNGSAPELPGGGDLPDAPGGGGLPDAPGGDNGSTPELPGGDNGSLPISTDSDVRPEEGIVRASAVTEGDPSVGTSVSCDLSAGWLRLCKTQNTAPVKASDLPADQLPPIPDPVSEQAPVSYGLLFLVVDTAVQEPHSMIYLALGTASDETPEESPVDPGNPPYNPNNPPINLADLNGSTDPTVQRTGSGTPQGSGDWRSIRAVEARLNDRVGAFVVGGVAQHEGTRYAGGAIGGSDGQTDYRGAVEVADDGRLWLNKEGFVEGNATLSQSDQRGGLAVDLGGQRYGQSFGGDGGGGGGGAPDLPVDPSQPPELPAGA